MTAEIEKLRERIATLQSDIHTLRRGVATRDEAAERLVRWVDDQAAGVSLRDLVASACCTSESIDDGVFIIDAPTSVDGSFAQTKMAELIAWAAGDLVKERLLATLDEMAPDHCSKKDPAARKADLTKKLKQLDQLEHDEEVAICQAEAAGYNVARRADCRPEIVLQVVAHDE